MAGENKFFSAFKMFTEKEDFLTVKNNIEAAIPFRGTNLWVLIFAIVIASLGLNMNSTAVIIGAMLISPLMGPIMGMGFSLGIKDPGLLRKAVANYVFATLVGLAASTVYFWVSPISEAHSEILSRTSPTIYDVLIAFFGGLAGIFATSSKLKGNVIPGVAIATALMPPLCTAGFGIATHNWNYLLGAFYLYFINSVYIAIATFLTVKFLSFPQFHFDDKKIEKRSRFVMWTLIILTLVPSIYFGYAMVMKNNFEKKVEKFISKEAIFPNNFLLDRKVSFEEKTLQLTYGGQKLDSTEISHLTKKASKYGLESVKLIVKQGFNFVEGNSNASTDVKLSDKGQMSKILSMQDSIRSTEEHNIEEILKEVKTHSQSVKELGFSQIKLANDSSVVSRPVTVIGYSGTLEKTQKDRIQEFLKLRLKQKEMDVIYTEIPSAKSK